MKDFRATLLREKFTLEPALPEGDEAAHTARQEEAIVALSNRIAIHLHSEDGELAEKIIVRTQNMHSCVRLAAAILKDFEEHGQMTERIEAMPFPHLWQDVIKGYEKDWNPAIWAAVYQNGRVLFESGERHPFLDIIEKCDARSKEDYEFALQDAEEAFQKAGRPVTIDYDSNIALILSFTPAQAKTGVILRSAGRTRTFNSTIKPKSREMKDAMRIPSILTYCAAILEGVQLCFLAGMTRRKLDLGLIPEGSEEARKGMRAMDRASNLGRALSQFEVRHVMTFRPEQPDFPSLIADAEKFADRALKNVIEEKIESGDLDKNDWVM